MEKPRNIVIGAKVEPEKVVRARELRAGMTEAEKVLWAQLRRNQLDGYHFRRQQVINGFIAHFYCHAARLVIEVDGEIHEGQKEQDAHRDQILTERGLRILHFRNQEVLASPQTVINRIRAALKDEKEKST